MDNYSQADATIAVPVLSRGKYYSILVDRQDANKVLDVSWWLAPNGQVLHTKYLGGGRKNERSQKLLLHRVITDAPNGFVVDHINGDTLDNRRSNLRVCTQSHNNFNRTVRNKNNTSGYKNISWYANAKRWVVKVEAYGKVCGLKYFKEIDKAVEYRDSIIDQFHKEYGRKI